MDEEEREMAHARPSGSAPSSKSAEVKVLHKCISADGPAYGHRRPAAGANADSRLMISL
ncbi:hypothetical protein [Streptomyces sp. NPDC008092]|uniref:hypothetical protein n=1 Tax=Streptomyces sp. NPDC008092 TaxID=3364808 RepID=UPI0036F14A7A